MNSLHGIKISNDERAVKGQTLTYDRDTRMLKLRGERLTPVFLNRASATRWAERNGAKVAVV